MSPRAAAKTDGALAARVAALASLGAAAIHLAAVPMHWQLWLPAGVFFAAIAAFQVIWALAVLVRPGAFILLAGIVANLVSAALWVVASTVGVPFGPHAGVPESVSAAGICALLLECYVVMGAAWVWHRGHRAEQVSGFGNGIVLTGAATVMASAVTLGVASGIQNDHHSPVDAHHPPHNQAEHGQHGHQVPLAPLEAEPELAPLEVESRHAPEAAVPDAGLSPEPQQTHEHDGDHHGG